MKMIVLVQIVFFILWLCLKPIFHTRADVGVERVFYVQSNLEITLEIILLLGLSFVMCKYILKSNSMILASLYMGLSLFILFEISKYVEHLLGFLPNYGKDMPIIISSSLSLVATLLYMSVLYVICLLLKKVM
jgi:hypothetical protein